MICLGGGGGGLDPTLTASKYGQNDKFFIDTIFVFYRYVGLFNGLEAFFF